MSPAEAIARLKEGNRHYTSGNLQHPHQSTEERTQLATKSYENLGMSTADAAMRRAELAMSQHPFAIIVGCADSRVPPEISLSVSSLCSGINDVELLRRQRKRSPQKTQALAHIQSLVSAIRPAVEAMSSADLETTVKANLNHVVQALRSSTPVLKSKVDKGELKVIGGYYSFDLRRSPFCGREIMIGLIP